MAYPKRKPLPKRSDRYMISRTVMMPGGQTARVQVNTNTGHARWNANGVSGLDRCFTGQINILDQFVPYSVQDSMYIREHFRRRRRPSLYDGTYAPWNE